MRPRFLRVLSSVAVLCLILLACNLYKTYVYREEKEYEEREGKREREREGEREGAREEEMEGEREEENEAGMAQQMMSWFRSRAYPDPYYLNDKYAKAWEQAKKLREETISQQSKIEAAVWTSLGPSTGIGGRILSIAVNPVRGASIYAGSASGGIWKSYNSGSNWRPVVTNFNTLGVPSIIINPLDTMIMYAGTGEVYRMDSTGSTPNPGNTGLNVWKTRGTYGIGVLKSSDGGYTWDTVLYRSMAGLFGVQRLRFNPINPKTVYACTTEGLYRTLDAGNTWSKILNLSFVWDVVINARDTNQIVASVGNLQNTVKGIWRSTNNGSSFTKITSGLPSSFRGFIRLDNVPTTGNRDTIVASIGIDETGSPDELFRSTNFGNTWTALASSSHTSYQFWSAHAIAINPSNTNRYIYAGVNTFSYTLPSTTGSIGGIHADIHDIKFDPSNSNIVYIACDGGMYRSNNGGTSFTSINNGLAATQFYATIGVSGTDPDLIIGGLQDNNVYMTTNGGASWSNFPNANADGAACAIDPINDNNIIASIDARGFYRSTNRGASSNSVMSYLGGPHDSRTAFVAPVVMCRKNPSVVYVGTDNLHKSTNGGASWSNNVAYVGNTTPNNWIEAVHKTAIAMEIPPSDPTGDTLYVSTSPFAQFDNDADGLWVTGQPNILKTTNGATPFTSIKGTLPNRFVMDFAISKTNRDSIYIVLGGFGTSHIYVSSNGGGTWSALGASLPDVPFNTIVFDPVNPKIIYAGCDLGVYASSDRGITWIDFNNGFWDATQVVDLQVSADNKLIAATHGKGIFKCELYAAITLPVRLLDFGGSNKGNYNELHWTVSQEQNLSHYELERSVDGQNYQTVTSKISGNSFNPVTYRYNDLVNAVSSEYYYRLKMIDKDRSYTYSAVIFIRTVTKNKFTIASNPFHEHILLQYHISRDQPVHIDVFNDAGSLLKTKEFTAAAGTGIYTVYGVDSYPRGLYVIGITGSAATHSFKLIKY